MAGKLPATGWKTNLRKKVDTIHHFKKEFILYYSAYDYF